jgi:peptide-methionine (S)-S-oxide reductase
MANAYFAAGCFWGVEHAFRQVRGVRDVISGYAGGHLEEPSYEQVCTGNTGHAETVKIEYDPEEITFGELLDVFFRIHDPTQVNRQGPDIGSQYRSAIFYTTEHQRDTAGDAKERLNASGDLSAPVATQIVPFSAFYPAEDYHQRYFEKHGISSCPVPESYLKAK